MLWRLPILLLAVSNAAPPSQGPAPAPIFRPALDSLAGKTRIPILLPSRLPFRLRTPGLVARGDTAASGYAVTLHYRGVPGDAGYAAGFFGHPGQVDSVPGDPGVRLADGTRAVFSPVSCGGSCAPANLWWSREGVAYNIQLSLPYTTGKRQQLRELVSVANAVVRAPAPTRAPGGA